MPVSPKMSMTFKYTLRQTVKDSFVLFASRVKDQANKEVSGVFYKVELQKVDKPNSYRIEEILRTQTIPPGRKKVLR